MPPAGVNMDLIREALARRMQGGGGTPMAAQQTQPSGLTPMGGPNNMGGAQPQMPPPAPRALDVQGGAPPASPTGAGNPAGNSALKAAGQANSPSFDDPTRVLGKALIGHLLKVL